MEAPITRIYQSSHSIITKLNNLHFYQYTCLYLFIGKNSVIYFTDMQK